MHTLKKFVIHLLVVLLAFQGVFAAGLLHPNKAQAAGAPSQPNVVLNELMWMGSNASSSDEWIELYNPGPSAVVISGWSLTHAATGGANLVIPASQQITAGGYYLISNFAKGNASTILNVNPDLVTTSVALSNTCQTIQLLDTTSTIVDQMGCNGVSYFAGVNAGAGSPNRSLERKTSLLDGTLASSWQSSIQQVGLTAGAIDQASPKSSNDDVTPPVAGTVRDGLATDADITTINNSYQLSWNSFSDPESGIDHFQVGLNTSASCNPASFVIGPLIINDPLATSTTLTPVSPLTDGRYFGCVSATNRQFLNDGATNAANTTAPIATDGLIVDANASLIPQLALTAGSNGTINEAWSVAAYAGSLIDHFVATVFDPTNAIVSQKNVAANLTATSFAGLTIGVRYHATIVAVDDQSNQASVRAGTWNVPVLDPTKISVSQNKPGSNDVVVGQATASDQPGTIIAYSQNPSDPNVENNPVFQIATTTINADRSFGPISIGDNLYATVWLQAVDQFQNVSLPLQLSNDIVAPNGPTLTNLSASCPATCQVTLNWQDHGPDTLAFQVGYTINNGTQQRSLLLTTPTATLTLPTGAYDFVVFALDAAGNVSLPSNNFHAELTAGVITTISLQNGTPITQTTALPGAKETKTVRLATALFGATKVEAAAPRIIGSTTTKTGVSATPKPNTTSAAVSTNSDWSKIGFVVVLLLVIAAGFYWLSRSFDDEITPPPPIASAPKTTVQTRLIKTTTKAKTKKKRPKRRPT